MSLEVKLDSDLISSTDVSYSMYSLPSSGTNRMLGAFVYAGSTANAPGTIDANGNVVMTLPDPPGVSYPATYYMLLSGTKSGRKWGTGRIPVQYAGPGSAPTPPPTSVCMVEIDAPSTHDAATTLNYTVRMVTGVCEAWQTWLISGTATGGPNGEGALVGQIDAVGGGPSGQYSQNLTGIPAGSYKIWARCNSNTGGCAWAWTAKAITLTRAGTPPSPPPGTTPAPAATWGTTNGTGGRPTVLAPTRIDAPPNAQFSFNYSITGTPMVSSGSYQSWATPGNLVTHVEYVSPNVYLGSFHTNGLAYGSYNYTIVARNDFGETNHNVNVVVGGYFGVSDLTSPTGVTPTPSPPPGTPPPPATGVPPAILAIPAAPMPQEADYTDLDRPWQSLSYSQPVPNDMGFTRRKPPFAAQFNAWNSERLQRISWSQGNRSGNQWKGRAACGNVVTGASSTDTAVTFKAEWDLPPKSWLDANTSDGHAGPDSEVAGYCELLAGSMFGLKSYTSGLAKMPNVPIQYKDIRSFWICIDEIVRTGDSPGWVAHDMRAFSTGQEFDTGGIGQPSLRDLVYPYLPAEFMITRQHYPSTYNTSDTSTSGRKVWEGTLGGVFFKLMMQYGAYAPLVQFRAVNGMPANFNGMPVIDFLLNTRYSDLPAQPLADHYPGQGWSGGPRGGNQTIFDPNWWWHGCTTGIEYEYGTGSAIFRNFKIRINQD